MSTYLELINEVLTIVPSPELDSLVRSKINQIIHYIAGTGDYHRALVETTIGATEGVDPATYIQAITLAADFRSVLYLKYPETVTTSVKIDVQDVKDIKHLEHCNLAQDIAYVAGGYLRIKHSLLTPEFAFGYYAFPDDLVADTDENWITQQVPGLIVDLTAAYILNLKGDNEDSKRVQNMAEIFTSSYIQAQVNAIAL